MATIQQIDPASVLIAVDLLPHSCEALKRGYTLARDIGAPAVVLHVVHETADNPGFYRAHNKQNQTTPMRDIADTMLHEFLESELKNLPTSTQAVKLDNLLVEGIPAQRILEVADRINARYLVMSSNGHGKWGRFWSGSVVEAVRKQIRCELLVLEPELEHPIMPSEHSLESMTPAR